jgi:hypothetical protein
MERHTHMSDKQSLFEKSPWLKVVLPLVVVLAIVAVWVQLRASSGDSFAGSAMTKSMTVVYSDTGEKIEMMRGQLTKAIIDLGMPASKDRGLTNPKTHKPNTGFLADRAAWDKLIDEINAEAAAASKK